MLPLAGWTHACGDCLEVLKDMESESVNCVMTSPPYWALRDYGVEGQLGLEPTFQEYINRLCDIFDEVKRVLRKDGTCWVNIGDTYSGNSSYSSKGRAGFEQKEGNIKEWLDPKLPARKRARQLVDMDGIENKCLCQIPSRFSIEMCNRGWILRNELIWYKPNCMPSSVKDRFTVDFEKIFFFVKNKRYWFETQYEPHEWLEKEKRRKNFNKKISYNSKYPKGVGATQRFTENSRAERYNKEGRNKRCVWKITTKPFKGAHFAVFPEKLVETPIKAGCPKGGTVLDPFSGAGTTGVVAKKLGRNFIGIELNSEYVKMSEDRIANTQRSMF